MEDLLKDAIADAKAVRETAIENAKLALEEAFTPTIQSMLSKKLQAEMSDDDDMEDEVEDEEEMEDEEAPEEGHYSEDEDEAEEAPAEDEEEMDAEDEVEESEVIEINGVKYIPLVSEEDEEEEEEMGDEEEVEEDEELDLEAIIRELEDELEEAKDEEVDEAKETEEVDEAKDTEEVDEAKDDEVDESKEEVDESDEVDLEEVIKAIEEEEQAEEEVNELETVKAELKDYRENVKILRGQLSEVNMLNAKLLFTNKLFRAFGLSEAQKVKVIETFDRAKNIREVKLVYSTLAESFGSEATPVNESVKIKGSASKVQASTKSVKAEEVITEGTEMRDRFKKLANIL